jgi:hypothetical protein
MSLSAQSAGKVDKAPKQRSYQYQAQKKVVQVDLPGSNATDDGQSDGEQDFQTRGVLASRATVVSTIPALSLSDDEGGEDGTEEKTKDKTPPGEGQGEPNLPEKFRGKSVEDVARSYTELEALTSRLAQTNAELSKTLATSKPEVTQTDSIKLPKDFNQLLLDDPEKALEVFSDLAAQKAADKANKRIDAKTQESDSASTIKAIKSYMQENHADLMKDEEAKKAVDAFAIVESNANPDGHPVDWYKQATARYLKLTGAAVAKTAEEKQAVEDDKAAAQVPKGQSKGQSGKIWKQSHIDYLVIHKPQEYAAQQSEIAKAYLSGRVR